MKVFRIVVGIVVILFGVAVLFLVAYLLSTKLINILLSIPFFSAALLLVLLGYDLLKGRSIKDDLFFLFFN